MHRNKIYSNRFVYNKSNGDGWFCSDGVYINKEGIPCVWNYYCDAGVKSFWIDVLYNGYAYTKFYKHIPTHHEIKLKCTKFIKEVKELNEQ